MQYSRRLQHCPVKAEGRRFAMTTSNKIWAKLAFRRSIKEITSWNWFALGSCSPFLVNKTIVIQGLTIPKVHIDLSINHQGTMTTIARVLLATYTHHHQAQVITELRITLLLLLLMPLFHRDLQTTGRNIPTLTQALEIDNILMILHLKDDDTDLIKDLTACFAPVPCSVYFTPIRCRYR